MMRKGRASRPHAYSVCCRKTSVMYSCGRRNGKEGEQKVLRTRGKIDAPACGSS